MTQDALIAFGGGREVRIIPKGWRHPRDDRGRHVPLLPADFAFDDDEQRASYANANGLMPVATGDSEIAAYEAVSEGTPISPPFPNTPEGKLALVNYCAKFATTFGRYHRADAEAWAALLFGDASIGIDGTVRG